MQEIFKDISEERKQEIQAVLTIITRAHSFPKAINILNSYRATLTPYEQQFMDFYFNIWMEAAGINGESNSN